MIEVLAENVLYLDQIANQIFKENLRDGELKEEKLRIKHDIDEIIGLYDMVEDISHNSLIFNHIKKTRA